MGLFDEIRTACAEVSRAARYVHIDESRVDETAAVLAAEPLASPSLDARHHHLGTPESTLAFFLTLDAVNFGSGWFPQLRKRAGMSGYYTVATALKDHFDNEGPWRAADLAEFDAGDCADLLSQDLGCPDVSELMGLFASALNDLGRFLIERYDGRFAGPIEEADGSAERLVRLLAAMPFFDDVQRYGEIRVPLYKRAQLTAADLSLAFNGKAFGCFEDLDALTIFADNLVPHVLRLDGLLVYDPDLVERIERGELLRAGSDEEIEIRAVALHAVERLVASVRAKGGRANAHQLDYLLWHRGHRPEIKQRPRHRARSVFY